MTLLGVLWLVEPAAVLCSGNPVWGERLRALEDSGGMTILDAEVQIEKLVDLPGVRWLVELPLLSSVLAGILPQLVLRLFFSLMPYILGFLERLEGLPAESDVEFGVVRKYFAFQVNLLRRDSSDKLLALLYHLVSS